MTEPKVTIIPEEVDIIEGPPDNERVIKMRKLLKTYEELNQKYDLRIKNILVKRK